MRLWHLPARPLPVVTRPIAGETIPSYARRLAAANDLTSYAILRALGQLTWTGPGKHLLMRDARLNDQAASRLEAYTAIPRSRLARALPALTSHLHPGDVLPSNRPALCFRATQTRQPCRECELAASGPSGPGALVRPSWTPLLCQRHRRWLGHPHETIQHDLAAAGDVLAAYRRLKGLLARSGDHTWAWNEFQAAWNMARSWAEADIQRMPALSKRWHDRAVTLGISPLVTTKAGKRPHWIVAFPEAVALTAILTDLDLRRHVALEWDDRPLYRRIAASIGEQSNPAWPSYNDPVRKWARVHRARFEQLRGWSWGRPSPPPERFK
jgi:hypothetical protein